MSVHPVVVRRAYDEPHGTAGARILVGRLWPRGHSKEKAHLDEWCKTVALSTALRKWYAQVPDRFDESASCCREELKEPERALTLRHLSALAGKGAISLLAAAKDSEISEAMILTRLLTH